MTGELSIVKHKSGSINIASVCCVMICGFMILLGNDLKQGALQGLIISFQTVIPTLFPFFVLSDLWACYFEVNEKNILARLFSKMFYIPPAGLSAFLTGSLCGFPLGVKTARDLYNNGEISREQMIRLSGFCNNPSAAFVISGVGAGLFGSIKSGVALYICCIFSAIICGFLFRKNESFSSFSQQKTRQSFDLVASIRNAGLASISLSSYIVFFSAIISSLTSKFNSPIFSAFLSSLLEICSAAKYISEISSISPTLKISLVAFALGFSGFSVHLQAFSLMPKEGSRLKYLLMKLTQGLLCALLSAVITI